MASLFDIGSVDSPLPAVGENVLQLQEALREALHAAQAAIRDTTRLTRLFSILSEPAPLELMLDRVLSTISELFAADIVVLLDPVGTGTLSPLAAIGLPEEMLHLPMWTGEDGNSATAMAARLPRLNFNIRTDPEVEPQLRELGAEVAAWVPVTDSRRARGVLILARCRPVPFDRADVDLLTAMAYRIGLALEQVQRSLQLARIARVGREIGCRLDESEVCNAAVSMLPDVLWANAAALVMKDPGCPPRCVGRAGLDPAWDPVWNRLTEHLLATTSLPDGQPYCTPELGRTEEWLSLDPPAPCPVRALLAVPIRCEEVTRGVLYAMRFSPFPLSHDTVRMAVLYAGQISAAMENARLYRQAHDELAVRMRTERKLRESEERFKLALMGGDLGMWDFNVAGGDGLLNDRWAGMLGYSPGEIEPCMRSWKELMHPDDLPHTLDALHAHLEGQTPYFESEHRLRSRSGRWVRVLSKGKVTHRDDEGRPLRIVGTNLDITEARQVEAERLSMERQRQQVRRVESLSRMAGGIAHHFNNQLMVAMGNLELTLGDLPEDTAGRSQLVSAMNACARASEISRLMLTYVGQVSPRKEPLDLAQAVLDTLPLLIASLPDNVHLRADPQRPGPVVMADGVHIRQALSNLLVNAVEAMGERGGEITLAVGRITNHDVRASRTFPVDWTPRTEDYACITVSDTGCGLDTAGLQDIFDPFYSTKLTGRGLGLPVALGLVRAHDGAIAVESRPGGGADFRLLFPLALQGFSGLHEEEAPAVEHLDGPQLVLVVDDEPMLRLLLQGLMAKLGYEVLEACDGLDAVETFRARRDDIRLVILDVSMPRMNGWEALTVLRAMRPGVPVLLVSGYDEAQVMNGEHPEWPQAFLHKPFGLKELKAALGRVRMLCPDL